MSKATTFIIESDRDLALQLRDLLKKLGYQVLGIAGSEQEARDKLQRFSPQIILMNIHLASNPQGVTFVKWVAEELDIPMIYLSKDVGNTTLVRTQTAGPFGYLFWPFENQNTYATIELARYHHQMEKNILEKQNWLNAILRSVDEGIIAVNQEGVIEFMNPVAEMLIGWSHDEVIGKSLYEIFTIFDEKTGESVDLSHVLSAKHKTGPLVGFEIELSNRYGDKVPIEASAAAFLDHNHNVRGAVLAFRNVSEIRKAMQEARQQATRAHALLTSISNLNSQLDLSAVSAQVIQNMVSALNFDNATILLYDELHDNYQVVGGLSQVQTASSLNPYQDEIPGSDFEHFSAFLQPVTIIHEVQLQLEQLKIFNKIVGLPDLKTVILVQLRQDKQLLGMIILSSTKAFPSFTKEDYAFIQGLADQATSAITNARLFEMVRSSRERLQLLSRRLVDVQEDERRFLAKELHDQVGQMLTGLQFILQSSKLLAEGNLKTQLEEAQTMVSTLIGQIRELSLKLRPSMLDDMGLLPSLFWHFEQYTRQTGIEVKFSHFGLDKRFSPQVEITAYRLVQESLTNVARYAKVNRAEVIINAAQDALRIQVIDNGAGFDAEQVFDSGNTFGLAGMRERVLLIGGELVVKSAQGEGTEILAMLPTSGYLERRHNERYSPLGR
jgi:PAS domain S-box-containing protein